MAIFSSTDPGNTAVVVGVGCDLGISEVPPIAPADLYTGVAKSLRAKGVLQLPSVASMLDIALQNNVMSSALGVEVTARSTARISASAIATSARGIDSTWLDKPSLTTTTAV